MLAVSFTFRLNYGFTSIRRLSKVADIYTEKVKNNELRQDDHQVCGFQSFSLMLVSLGKNYSIFYKSSRRGNGIYSSKNSCTSPCRRAAFFSYRQQAGASKIGRQPVIVQWFIGFNRCSERYLLIWHSWMWKNYVDGYVL